MIQAILRRPTTWLVLAFFVVVLLAVRELASRSPGAVLPAEQGTVQLQPPPRSPQIFSVDPMLGVVGAPVTVVLFSDFACPFCAEVAPIVREAAARYGDKIRVVWKDLPSPRHPEAWAAAEAAECAAAQGKFWQYHDRLFADQANLGSELYDTLARELGLSAARFSACRVAHEPRALLERNRDEAAAAGVDATPYLFVNGRAWSGAFTTEELEQIIQQAVPGKN